MSAASAARRSRHPRIRLASQPAGELIDHADFVEEPPSGRIRRYWYRRTVWVHADARTGRQSTGRAPGTTDSRKPHPYADDPRVHAAAELLGEGHEADETDAVSASSWPGVSASPNGQRSGCSQRQRIARQEDD